MEATIKATLGKELYYTEVKAGNNTIITDEPADLGGGDKGMNPFEVLTSALASCTAATLRMYMDRKQWFVDKINVEIKAEQDKETNQTIFNRVITFEGGNLTDDDKKRLLVIANKCPIHKILTGDNVIPTEIK